MSIRLGGVSTCPRFILYIVSQLDQRNDIHFIETETKNDNSHKSTFLRKNAARKVPIILYQLSALPRSNDDV